MLPWFAVSVNYVVRAICEVRVRDGSQKIRCLRKPWPEPFGCSAELELVAVRTERKEVSVGAAVHRPAGRPPTREAVTLGAAQRVAGQGARLLDSSTKGR